MNEKSPGNGRNQGRETAPPPGLRRPLARLQVFWRRLPLFRQVFLAMFCSILATTSLYFAIDIYSTNRRFQFMERATMQASFPVLQRIIEDAMLHRTREHVRDLLLPAGRPASPERMYLLDTNKQLVDLEDMGAGLKPRRYATPNLDANRYMVMDFPMRAKPACYQCHTRGQEVLGYVRIVSDHRERTKSVADHFKLHVALLVVSAILMGLWALMIVRRMIQVPLARIVSAMGRVSQGRFDTRIEDLPSGEMREIAAGFNAMVRKIEEDRGQILELHRKQVAHMERLVAVGEVAAYLAHEVRNPLTGIGSAIQIMQRETPADNPRGEVFGKILAQLNRMDQAMANFLSFARMPETVVKPFDFAHALRRVAFLVAPRLKSQQIELRQRLPERLPAILGDAAQIEQVFLNLLLNAVQAMPSGGRLSVEARTEPHGIVVEVADTGHGISRPQLEQVFKPFFTTREKGSGLGLPIAKQIVMAHGGDIWIESLFERGTSVFVRLPAANGDAPGRA